MPRYDVFLEGRTESSTCYFGVAVMADDQKEAEYLGHEAGRKKHRECDEIEVVSVRRKDVTRRRTHSSLFDWIRTRNARPK
jgi:hypothetical protein